MIYKNGKHMRDFLGLYIFIVVQFSVFWGGVFNKTIIPLALVGYPTRAHGIIVIYNIASRATQSNSVYVSVLQISTVLADGVSKLLCQNFFSRERPLSTRGKILYFATMMDTETRPTSPKTNTIFRPFLVS